MQLGSVFQVATTMLLASQLLPTLAVPLQARDSVSSIKETISKRQDGIDEAREAFIELERLCKFEFTRLTDAQQQACGYVWIPI